MNIDKLQNAEDYDDTATAEVKVEATAPLSGPVAVQVVEMDTGITATFTGHRLNRTKTAIYNACHGVGCLVILCLLLLNFYQLWPYASVLLLIQLSVFILSQWILSFELMLNFDVCTMREASHIHATNDEGASNLCVVESTRRADGSLIYFFTYRYVRFVFVPSADRFVIWNVNEMIRGDGLSFGLTEEQVSDRRSLVGSNGYELEPNPWYKILGNRIISPFNVFQFFAAMVWSFREQIPYAVSIALVSGLGIYETLMETLDSDNHLREMAYFSCPVNVLRAGEWRLQLPSEELVPGDIFEIDCDMEILPCDALLISGEVLLNESMLTGESIPVVRKSIPSKEALSAHLDDKSSILYAGTRLMRVKGGGSRRTLAIAIRTGFDTYKGFLIRQIMFPPPLKFKFYQDSVRFYIFLSVLGFFGMVYTVAISVYHDKELLEIVLDCLDLMTVVVPPALPAVLVVGISIAMRRLKRFSISSTYPDKLNVCGRLDVFCFDKTGTLTEEGLDICAVIGTKSADRSDTEKASDEDSSDSSEDESTQLTASRRPPPPELPDLESSEDSFSDMEDSEDAVRVFANPVNDPLELSDKFFHLLSCCHTVTPINGRLVGDPLDLKMFEFTGCVLEEPDHSPDDTNLAGTIVRPFEGSGNELKIIRSFPFEASLKRQSVLIRDVIEDSYEFYTKGAPEVIKESCLPASVPEDFDDLLGHYARHGQRVVACAYRRVTEDVERLLQMPREEIESELIFLGFIVFENKLKEESPVAIKRLGQAHIRSVMVTGDNVLTAINVSRKCGIVSEDCKVFFPVNDIVGPRGEVKFVNVEDSSEWLTDLPSFLLHHKPRGKVALDVQLALTGRIFSQLKDLYSWPLFSALLSRCNIYARMSPLEKHELVEELQELDHCVAMVGDGANDCGALRVADVGVSLSETEASLAAPFCSSKPTIDCAPLLVRFGRCSLATTFASFKYMTLYSVVQFTTCCLLRWNNTNISSWQFIAFDMITVLALGSSLSSSGPSESLDCERPADSLISLPVLASILSQACVQIAFQTLVIMKFVPEGQALDASAIYGDHIKVAEGKEVIVSAVALFKNALLIPFSAYQYIWTALVYSFGGKFRAPIYKNWLILTWSLLLFVGYTALLFTTPDTYVDSLPFDFLKWIVTGWKISYYYFGAFLPRGKQDIPQGVIDSLAGNEREYVLRAAQDVRMPLFGLALLNGLISFACELLLVPLIISVGRKIQKLLPRRPTTREELDAISVEDLERSNLPVRKNLNKKPIAKKL